MRVFVTGGTGLVGSHTVERLERDGHEVVALVRKTSDTSHLQSHGATLVTGDVTDRASIERGLSGANIDAVIHAAAVVTSRGEWSHYEEVGVRGTENVVRAMHATGVRRLIHISSTAVYGFGAVDTPLTEDQPVAHDCPRWNHYVREKVGAEDVIWKAHERGEIVATSLRPGVIFGLRDRNCTPGVLANMKAPKPALVGEGDNIVSCVAVQDVVDAVVRALEKRVSEGKAYNLTDPKMPTQLELYQMYAEASGLNVPTTKTPLFMAVNLSRAFNWLHRKLSRPGDPPFDPIMAAVWGSNGPIDSTRAMTDLGWRAEIDLRQSIAESVDWHMKQSVRPPPMPSGSGGSGAAS